MADGPGLKPVTTHALLQMKEKGERIVMLTCYDALFARLLDASGVDVLLVGDSVNQVLAGADSTLSATLDQMIYHTKIVRRGTQRAMVVCDMPFLTYQVTKEEAIRNGGRVMAETGCQAIKVEGGRAIADTVRAVVDVGIPVMGHLGLTPQSVHALGGHRVQGRDDKTASRTRARLRSSWSWCLRRSRVRSRRRSRFPRSASGRGRTATARCWCFTTCSG